MIGNTQIVAVTPPGVEGPANVVVTTANGPSPAQVFIYEPLAIFNRLAGNKWEYRLAESFELADDLKSISFTLRDGLKWSDGEPYTADDVERTLRGLVAEKP